jgi:hypothetical protein
MSNEAAWLLLSFAIMVVAMLATLYEKIDGLQKRLDRLEGREGAADETPPAVEPAQAFVGRPRGRRDYRA